jgi:hypothetical protein
MKNGRKYAESPTGLKYSDDPIAYRRAYQQLEDEKQLARKRAKRRREQKSSDPEYKRRNVEYLREWKKRNPQYMAEYRKRNIDRLKQTQRERNLRSYGLTPDDFDRMMQNQNGKCAICNGEPSGRWKTLFVDHDHKTGAVRGLLCHLCNSALERVDNFRNEMMAYLEKHK